MHKGQAGASMASILVQGQSEDVSEQLNEEEQLLVISRLHQVSLCSLCPSPVAFIAVWIHWVAGHGEAQALDADLALMPQLQRFSPTH